MKKLLSIFGVFAFGTTVVPATLSTVACAKDEYTKEDFEALVKQISELDESKYTTESMANLIAVMTATATEVAAGNNVSENYKKLKAAFDALVLVDESTGDSNVYTLKDLFEASLFDGDDIKVERVFESQEEYDSVTRDETTLKRYIWLKITDKLKGESSDIIHLIRDEFMANVPALDKTIDTYHETTFVISKDLTSTVDNITVKATQIVVKYKLTIA